MLNYLIHPSLNSCSSLMYRSPNLTVRFACFWKIGVKSRVGAPQKMQDSRGEILISLTLVFWSTEWPKAKWGIFNIKQFNILVQSLLRATFLLLHRFQEYTCIKEAFEKVTFCIRSPCMILLEDAYALGDLLLCLLNKNIDRGFDVKKLKKPNWKHMCHILKSNWSCVSHELVQM